MQAYFLLLCLKSISNYIYNLENRNIGIENVKNIGKRASENLILYNHN